jgi:glycine cleavage system H lipoate-binding protein
MPVPGRVADAILRGGAGGEAGAVQRVAAFALRHDSHRYCELYGAMAHPVAAGDEVDGIAMPAELSYAANHLWLEVGEGGQCHAGIDAFLSRALGNVERIQYVWQQGLHRPAAILTAGGADWEVVFPNPLLLTGCNLYLRANPGRLAAEPYTAGWLFEGSWSKAPPTT